MGGWFISGGEEGIREELGVVQQDQRFWGITSVFGEECSSGLGMVVNEAWLLQMGNRRKSKDLGEEIW